MSARPTQLDKELAFYGEQKDELLKHHFGQYVLIKGREIVGTFTKFEEAYEQGVKRFGTVPMLIKQVVSEEPVQKFPALTHGLIRAHP